MERPSPLLPIPTIFAPPAVDAYNADVFTPPPPDAEVVVVKVTELVSVPLLLNLDEVLRPPPMLPTTDPPPGWEMSPGMRPYWGGCATIESASAPMIPSSSCPPLPLVVLLSGALDPPPL